MRQGKARPRAGVAVTFHHPRCRGWPYVVRYLPSLWAKAMQTVVQPSLTGVLSTFTAQLDALHVDQSPDDLSNALRAAFEQRQLYHLYVFTLAGDLGRAKALLEVFDKVRSAKNAILWIGSQHRCAVQALQSPTHDVVIFKRFRQLCGRVGLLPASHVIQEKFIKTAEHPIAHGGFGDVWEGRYGDKRVAIKALRIYKEGDVQKVRKVTDPAFSDLVDASG
jgi:hypothetical protein